MITSKYRPQVISLYHNSLKSDIILSEAAVSPELKNANFVTDLYYKCDDEPDFDCDFLCSGTYNSNADENTIDPDSENELTDEFNDDQWDADIYDPYLESSYY